MAKRPICSIPGCGKPVHPIVRGYCNAHDKRFVKYGDPLAGALPKGAAPKFVYEVALRHEADECLIWPYGKTTAGYGMIMLKNVPTYVHILVCTEAHGVRPQGRYEAAHSCGNPSCCAPNHLRWATPSENQIDKRKHGTHNHGMQHPHCKLSDADVREIMALKGVIRTKDLAKRYGVSHTRISTIQSGKARQRATGEFH